MSSGDRLKKMLDDAFTMGGETAANVLGEVITDGIIGQAFPGVANIVLGYRQKKFERNINLLVNELASRQNELGQQLSKQNETLEFFRSKIFPVILDRIGDEVQERKILLLVKGIEYIIDENLTDNDEAMVISYYDVFYSLRLEEIKNLITFTPEYHKYAYLKWERQGIELDFKLFINDKDPEKMKYLEKEGYKKYLNHRLESFGLIDSGLQKTLSKLVESTDEYSSSEKTINTTPNPELTEFGKGFIRFFKLKYQEDLME